MKDYVIFTDASADMPDGYAEKNDIRIVPMNLLLDDNSYTWSKRKVKTRSGGFTMPRETDLQLIQARCLLSSMLILSHPFWRQDRMCCIFPCPAG